ncbi:MAG TPA: homocysteine S-methyltransferase family protein, partial [Fervidobacterium sp.]|nr:homocysteine S-methyltransferase family protein [Fervidobacterium sp.]
QDEYVRAGVDFLLTNTFSGNRHKLRKLNCEEFFYDINVNAVRIAKESAKRAKELYGRDVYVLGDISSVGEMVYLLENSIPHTCTTSSKSRHNCCTMEVSTDS